RPLPGTTRSLATSRCRPACRRPTPRPASRTRSTSRQRRPRQKARPPPRNRPHTRLPRRRQRRPRRRRLPSGRSWSARLPLRSRPPSSSCFSCSFAAAALAAPVTATEPPDSGRQVVERGVAPLADDVRGDPLPECRAQPVEPGTELVAVALHDAFDREIRDPAPGQALQQVPGGPLDELLRVRPERAALVAKVRVGVAGQQRQPVGGLEARVHLLDHQRVRRIGHRAARQHQLAGPDAVGADWKVLVEADASPDRAPDGGIVDEERQGLVAYLIAHPIPPPVWPAAEALAEAERGQRIALQWRLLPAVDAADRRVLEGRRQVTEPVAV